MARRRVAPLFCIIHPYVRDIVARRRVASLFCDIHPQMNATILSLDTPYYTQPNAVGQYEFEQLPPGTYELRIYHPDLAPVSATIEIEAE